MTVGADLFPVRHRYPPFTQCPGCRADLTRVAVVELAYVFDVCECGTPDYPHLVEQLWHREHLWLNWRDWRRR